MNSIKSITSIIPTAIAAAALLVAGCGNDEQAEQAEQAAETGESPRMIQREAPRSAPGPEPEEDRKSADFRVVPDLEGKLEQDGMGLETIIDASSKQAYAESLRWIAEDVSQQQYESLERSLRMIQAYDSSVLGNEKRFLESIDGKTGQEVIDRATQLIQNRR